MKKVIVLCIMGCLLDGSLIGKEKCTISGRIYIVSSAPVYIFLVDEETYRVPFTGVKRLIIQPTKHDQDRKYVTYRFSGMKQGIYGIRCFQDENQNGRLDKGLFGPSEPWGLSWNENKKPKWPSFENFQFSCKGKINDMVIRLKK